jgi:GxxExxY protein
MKGKEEDDEGGVDPSAFRYHDVDPEINRLIVQFLGVAIAVHKVLGPGHLEDVYEKALCIELRLRGIAFEQQYQVAIVYKGIEVGKGEVDLFIEGKLVVELKAVSQLVPVHEAQIISYLKMTGCKAGLLINFNVPLLKHGIKRFVHPDLLSK